MLPKELEFVYYEMNKPIVISNAGKKLIKSLNSDNYLLEEQIFTNAFVKYHRINPYSKVLNNNKPLILLLSTLRFLSTKYYRGFKSISKQELSFILCWRDNEFVSLGTKILEIRKKHGFSLSDDFYYEQCLELLGVNLKSSNRFKKDNILKEMTDEFIRKMRLTSLITLRGAGRFIDINTLRNDDVNYVISTYSNIMTFKNNDEYFSFMSSIDNRFMSDKLLTTTLGEHAKVQKFMNWVNYFSFNELLSELMILANTRASSKHDVLKYIKESVRLEFIISLILQKKYTDITVIPNYISDDEGIPVVHEPGGKADIICEGTTYSVLFEVTLLTGVQQHIRESFSITRHLKEYCLTKNNVFSILVAPTIHEDTREHATYIKFKEKLDIVTLSFSDFTHTINFTISLEDFKN